MQFIPLHIAGFRGYVNPAFDSEKLHKALLPLLASGFTSQKAYAENQERQVFLINLAIGEFYLKRYQTQRIKHCVRTILGLSKAQKSWRLASLLEKKNIATPRPVAYLRYGSSILPSEQLLVTEGVLEAISLRRFVHQYIYTGTLNLTLKRQFFYNFAEFMANIHIGGVYHGDFTSDNILVAPLDSGNFKFYLIDLDAIRSTHWIPKRRRIKNIDEIGRNFMRLDKISTSDRARFIKHYLKLSDMKNKSFKAFFTETYRRTIYRLERNRKKVLKKDD